MPSVSKREPKGRVSYITTNGIGRSLVINVRRVRVADSDLFGSESGDTDGVMKTSKKQFKTGIPKAKRAAAITATDAIARSAEREVPAVAAIPLVAAIAADVTITTISDVSGGITRYGLASGGTRPGRKRVPLWA